MTKAKKFNYLNLIKILNRVFVALLIIFMFARVPIMIEEEKASKEAEIANNAMSNIEITLISKMDRNMGFNFKNNGKIQIDGFEALITVKVGSGIEESFGVTHYGKISSNSTSQANYNFYFYESTLRNTSIYDITIEYEITAVTIDGKRYYK